MARSLLVGADLGLDLLAEGRIRDIDLGRGAQVLEQFGVLGHEELLFDLVAQLIEGRLGSLATVFDLDDVPAELRLDGC